MAKKPRLREDAFAWVRDTSQPEEKPKALAPSRAVAAEKTKPSVKPKTVIAEKPRMITLAAGVRLILVRYENIAGRIVGILEIKSGGNIKISWDASVRYNMAEFELSGELAGLAGLELLEIHEKHKVDVSGSKPRLV